MARTPTTQIPLGFSAPDFNLLDTISGKYFTKNDCFRENGLVVMFICNHCPFVIHIRHILVEIAHNYINKGIGFVAISSNDVFNYPDDSPEKMMELGMELKFPFPYLYDESQEVAKLYTAACTPDFSVFDKDQICIYRGQLDDSRPGNDIPVTGKDLKDVLECIVLGQPVPQNQKPSIGCNIKWKE